MQWESLPGAPTPMPRSGQRDSYLPPLEEGTATTHLPQRPPNVVVVPPHSPGEVDQEQDNAGYFGIGRRLSNAARQTSSRFFPTLNTVNTTPDDYEEDQYESEMVDVLDTVGKLSYRLNGLGLRLI